MRFSNPITFAAACFLFIFTNNAHAQTFTPPDDCVAYYRFDPTQFESSSSVASFLPFAIQLGTSTGLINESFRPLFDGLAAAAIAGAVPHSITLYNFDGQFDPKAKNNFRITNLQAVLSLETAANHRTYVQSLSQILSHYQPENPEDDETPQTLIQLKSGQAVAHFQLKDWQDWQAIEWASTTDGFLVGIGTDSIKTHLAQIAVSANATSLADHFKFPDSAPSATHFLSFFVDFEELHAAMPEILAEGRPRRMLTTWKLDYARNLFLHGRMKDKYILFDITYERRADPDRIAHHRPLTLDHWPDTLELPQPPGDFLMVIPMEFEATFDRIVSAYRATLSSNKLAVFNEQMRQYHRRNRTIFQALWTGFKPYLIISNYPKPPVPIPGAASLYFEMDGKKPNSRAMQNRLEALLDTFLKSPNPTKLGESAVRYDKKQRLYFLQLEKTGMLRIPSWGWVGNRYLVGGWGPPVVEVNREWLESRDR